MAPIEEFAPAKINLTLHVTGRRADGYHLLDSLVVFADVGDRVIAEPADDTTLFVTGPRAAGVPADGRNLMMQAALLTGRSAALTLDKHLPAAAGIGGGSADAAATLRAMTRLGAALPPADAVLGLGADVPVCLAGRAARMTGVGECLTPVPALPSLPAVLVNPGVGVSTPAVFQALADSGNPPMAEIPAGMTRPGDLAAWLALQRNDLEAPARSLAPVISDVIRGLSAQAGCLLARMSGSGATCFGLFATPDAAQSAADELARVAPAWWVVPTTLA